MAEAAAVAASLVAAYLFGSLPSAWFFARLAGHDIFTTGSGNMGTMNTARHVGILPGVLTLLTDVAKGALALAAAAWLGQALAPAAPGAQELALGAAAFAAGLGHVFPVFTGFRGGKALAVSFGVLLPGHALIAAAGLVLIGLLVLLFRNVDTAAIITVSAAAVAVLVQELSARDGSLPFAGGVLLLATLIVLKHLQAATASGRNGRRARP